jgi:hypothetical protein
VTLPACQIPKTYPPSRRRAICARAFFLVLLTFVLVTNGWFASVGAASVWVGPDNEVIPLRVSPFDSESNTTGSLAVRHECTSVASVRWLPNSTLTIAYARGDFTGAERGAFHKAVSLWQRALAEANIEIVLEESGETDKYVEPARSQVIIKRDNSMDDRHYGKIVAFTRPDNYVDRAFILIRGSLHKRDTLRKVLLHELGHGFGLRDCPDCPSRATVMNYFSQQSVMGFKIRKGSKISDQPTACDISQMSSGYRQSPPPMSKSGEDEAENAQTVVADEMVEILDAKSSNRNDNIIAPYLNPAASLEGKGPEINPHSKPAVLKDRNLFTGATYSRGTKLADIIAVAQYDSASTLNEFKLFAFAQHPEVRSLKIGNTLATLSYLSLLPVDEFNLPANPPPFTANQSKTVVVGPYAMATPAKEIKRFSFPLFPSITLAKNPSVPGLHSNSALDKRTSAFAIASYLTPPLVPEANLHTVGTEGRKESALSEAEKTALESSLPTLLNAEAETMEELNNYTFRRDVLIQTIDGKGRVSGEYHRVSDMLFDDSGMRIERGLHLSKPTLRRLTISPEYIEDFSGAQLKGFELAKRDHYRIEPFMTDVIDGVAMRVYRITPLNINAERAAQARVFYGFAWVDEKTGKIVKIKGCALPDDKQRYPVFETQRELVDGLHLFPARTIADNYLVFPSHRVHIRMLITYSNYKRFSSRVKITEVEN